MLDLEIIALTPDKLDDYLYFFENVAHTDNRQWDRCYCVDYCSDKNLYVGDFDAISADERREYAVRYVKEGILQGYMAYADGKMAGWCNANDRASCRNCTGWRQIFGSTRCEDETAKIKSIFCFTVAPAMRSKGIAEALLKKVIEDAVRSGYDFVEGYPNKSETDMYYNYVGPEALYRKLGFEKYGETENRYVYRKKL